MFASRIGIGILALGAVGVVAWIAAGKGNSMVGEDRVVRARTNCEADLTAACRKLGLAGLPSRFYLRAFKEERELEAWGYHAKLGKYIMLRTYKIAAMSGELGPKRKEGDLQVPEGFYRVAIFNPQSRFHLSLGLDYPNASDKVLSDPSSPGSDIYIHGGRASIGCLAMTDEKIEEIYLLALAARGNEIPVHIFPARLTARNLSRLGKAHPAHFAFWNSLRPMFDEFERTRRVPRVRVGPTGEYVLDSPR